MSDNFLKDILSISENTSIEFKELYGFTFVFTTKVMSINTKITSAEIRPVGIIYTENDEYYFAPLDNITNLDVIIKKYVENYILK